MRFQAEVLLGGKTATGIEAPAAVVESLGAGKRPPVRFDALSYSNRRRHVLSVEEAKTAETRRRRIDKAVAALREGG